MINSLQFWTLLVGLVGFVIRFLYPTFPFDNVQILAFVVFILGLIGIVPQIMQRRFLGLTLMDLLKSKAFWTLVAGLGAFVVHYYLPEFPLDEAAILALIVFVLNAVGINPELRYRGVL